MTNFVQVKVEGGKLLQLEKTSSGYKITGDFFAHPAEAITELETTLNSNPDQLTHIFSKNQIIGFGETDLLNLYQQLND